MNRTLYVCLSLLAGLTFKTASAETIPTMADGRCGTWGDSLNLAQASTRVQFALKCENDRRKQVQIKRAWEDKVSVANDPNKREGYPTYGFYDDKVENYTNPAPYYAPPLSADNGCNGIPHGYEVAFFCAQGCYTGDQSILFLAGEESIADARSAGIDKIQVLDENSTIENIRLKEAGVARYITDVVPGAQETLLFKMKSGKSLQVTKNHPLIDAKGVLRSAASLKVGEALVKSTGEKDSIVSIEEKNFNGRVYNVAVSSSDPKNHVVVAQGYLNGALYYQNEGVKELNRLLLRSGVTKNLIQ